MGNAKTKRIATTATSKRALTSPQSRSVNATAQDVARRAYELYMSRGCDAGHDVDDWLQAERELNIDEEC